MLFYKVYLVQQNLASYELYGLCSNYRLMTSLYFSIYLHISIQNRKIPLLVFIAISVQFGYILFNVLATSAFNLSIFRMLIPFVLPSQLITVLQVLTGGEGKADHTWNKI